MSATMLSTAKREIKPPCFAGFGSGFPGSPNHSLCFPWETGWMVSLPHPLWGGGREGKPSSFPGVSGQGRETILASEQAGVSDG